jgi:hypothetical protein
MKHKYNKGKWKKDDLFEILDQGEKYCWNDEENMKLLAGLKLYGKDYNKLSDLLPGRTVRQVASKCSDLKSRYDHGVLVKDDIYDVLNGGYHFVWTDDLIDKFKQGVKLYGKNYDKLSEVTGLLKEKII